MDQVEAVWKEWMRAAGQNHTIRKALYLPSWLPVLPRMSTAAVSPRLLFPGLTSIKWVEDLIRLPRENDKIK